MSFMELFQMIYRSISAHRNDTAPVCTSKIGHQQFHTFLLIPSGIMIMVLAFTIQRKNKALDCFHGRPGAIFPMDILGTTHRFPYAAAWGSIAFLVADIVIHQQTALDIHGPPIVTALNVVLTLLMYGINYFPLFAALGLQSVTGYVVGTAYAWMFLGTTIYKTTECDFTAEGRFELILRDIPKILCLGILSISLPVQIFYSLKDKTRALISSSEMVSILTTTQKLGNTPEGQHVKQLFEPVPPPSLCLFIELVSNSFDPYETPSNSASHKDPICWHMLPLSGLCLFIELVSNSFDPYETPSNSASHKDPICWHMLPLSGLCLFIELVSNSFDPYETPSNSASHKDPICWHMLPLSGLCLFIELVSNSFDPYETPSNSASHKDPICWHMLPLSGPEPTTKSERAKRFARHVFSEWVYHKQSNFRYSSRMSSVMLIGVVILYKITIEIMLVVLALFNAIEQGIQIEEEMIMRYDPSPVALEMLGFDYIMVVAIKGCFITAIPLAFFIGLLNILHTMTSHRNNMFDLYKGKSEHIPHRSTLTSSSLLIGSIRYAGYQVGYIAWGFIVHSFILLLIALILAVAITLIRIGVSDWVIYILIKIWPAVLMYVIFIIGQIILARLFFLQESDTLALDNRRFLFTFAFFMFFYNIFIGLVSCLLRIIKSIAVGAFFLARLDNSALPRRFQMLDPGFAAYVGFIHVEASHTHPVLMVFLRILLSDMNTRRKTGIDTSEYLEIDMKEHHGKDIRNTKRSSSRARTRWFLLYTLYNNPTLRSQRKQYIEYVKMLRERLTRHYNMNKSAMGKMMKSANQEMTSPVEQTATAEGPSTAQINWNMMLGRNRLWMAIQNLAGNSSMVDHAFGDELSILEMAMEQVMMQEAAEQTSTDNNS